MQAVVKIGKSQHLITSGQTLLVDRPVVDQTLLVIDGTNVTIGQPDIKSAHIKFTDEGLVLGDKVRTATYKAKSRYRKVKGFRPKFHKIKIEGIELREKK